MSKVAYNDDKDIPSEDPSVLEVTPEQQKVDPVLLNKALRKVDFRLLPVLGLLWVRAST